MKTGSVISMASDFRRKYGDCIRLDGNCADCSLTSYGKDCHGARITALEWYRRLSGMTIKYLSETSGVSVRQIQSVERGERSIANMTVRNVLSLADAMGVEVSDLIDR